MTRRLLAIFNLLDASPPNVPVLLEKAVSENGEKNRLMRYVITLNGASHVFFLILDNEINFYFTRGDKINQLQLDSWSPPSPRA